MKTKEKIGTRHPLMRPKVSFLDPTYTFTVSRYQTAAGVVDIMSHVLENYFSSQGKDLISLMNSNLSSLGIKDSHFTNTTGLHDESLYTTLDDYARVVIDTLNNADAKEILKSYRYTLDDGITVRSTLRSLENYFDEITIYGGKTGFTGEAGENLMVLYSTGGRSYLLILASAPGNPYVANENYHFIDAVSVLEYLYN